VNDLIRRHEAEIVSLLNDVKPLVEKSKAGTLSDDENARFDELTAQINTAQEAKAKAMERYAAAAKLEGDMKTTTEPKRELTHEAQAKDQAYAQSLGRKFAESQQVKEFAAGGSKRSKPFGAESFYHHTDDGPTDVRTLIGSAALPADFVRPDLLAGIYRGDLPTNDLRSVLINGTTTSDAITFIRELAFTNNAAGVLEATHTDAADETPVNASVKPESALTFEQATAPVVTIAHWIPITRQTLQDASQLQAYVENRLLEGLKLEESDQLLNGTGAPDLTGILQTTGIQDLDDTYFSGAAVNDAGQDNEVFNRILRGRRMVRTTGRAQANFVVLNPADYENIITFTDADRGYFGSGPFSSGVMTTLWGMRVVEDEAMTAGFALVGDGRMAAVWDRMQSQIFIDTIDDQFIRNMLTILAEERLALTVFRPAAFALVEF
jgi:HK97 family phage major capsid protein